MNEPMYDPEEVHTRCYDLGLLLKMDGIDSFLPDNLNQKFFLHYGCDIPWRGFGYTDLVSFLEANPGLIRDRYNSGRFACMEIEGYKITRTIPVPPTGEDPLMDFEADPDFMDFNFDDNEIPLYSPGRSPSRREHHDQYNDGNRGILADDGYDLAEMEELWADVPLDRFGDGALRAVSPPPAVQAPPAVSPRTINFAASAILHIEKKKLLAELEGQGAQPTASTSRATHEFTTLPDAQPVNAEPAECFKPTRSRAVIPRLLNPRPQNTGQQQQINDPSLARAPDDVTPGSAHSSAVVQEDLPLDPRLFPDLNVRIIPTEAVDSVQFEEPQAPETHLSNTIDSPPLQPLGIPQCKERRILRRRTRTVFPFNMGPAEAAVNDGQVERVNVGQEQIKAPTTSPPVAEGNAVLPGTQPVKVEQSERRKPARARAVIPRLIASRSVNTGQQNQVEAPVTTDAISAPKTLPVAKENVNKSPITIEPLVDNNANSCDSTAVNAGQSTVNVKPIQGRIIPSPASLEHSPEKEIPTPVAAIPLPKDAPRKIARARTVRTFRRILERQKKEEEEPVTDKAQLGNLTVAVARFRAKSRPTVLRSSSLKIEGEKEVEKEAPVPSDKDNSDALKLGSFAPVKKDPVVGKESSGQQKPLVNFAIKRRAKTILPQNKLFAAAAAEDDVEKIKMPSRAKSRLTVLPSQISSNQPSFSSAHILVDKVIACLKEHGSLSLEELASAYNEKFPHKNFYVELKDYFQFDGLKGLEKLSYGQIVLEKSRNPMDDSFRHVLHLRTNTAPPKYFTNYTTPSTSNITPSSSSFSITPSHVPASSRSHRSRWESPSSRSPSPEGTRSRRKSPGIWERKKVVEGNESPNAHTPASTVYSVVSLPPQKRELSVEAKEQLQKLLEAQKTAPPPPLGPHALKLARYYVKEHSKDAEVFSDRVVTLLTNLGSHTPFSSLEFAFLDKFGESFAALCTKHLPAEAPFNHLRLISAGRIEVEIIDDSNDLFFYLKHPVDVLFDGIVECLQKLNCVGDLKDVSAEFKTTYNDDFQEKCRDIFGAHPFHLLQEIAKMARKFILDLKGTTWTFALTHKHLIDRQRAASRRFWQAHPDQTDAISSLATPSVSYESNSTSKMSVIDIFFERIEQCLDKIHQDTTVMAVAKIYVVNYKYELRKIIHFFFGDEPYAPMSEEGVRRKKFSLAQEGPCWWFRAPDGGLLKPIVKEPGTQRTPNPVTPRDRFREEGPVPTRLLAQTTDPLRGRSPLIQKFSGPFWRRSPPPSRSRRSPSGSRLTRPSQDKSPSSERSGSRSQSRQVRNGSPEYSPHSPVRCRSPSLNLQERERLLNRRYNRSPEYSPHSPMRCRSRSQSRARNDACEYTPQSPQRCRSRSPGVRSSHAYWPSSPGAASHHHMSPSHRWSPRRSSSRGRFRADDRRSVARRNSGERSPRFFNRHGSPARSRDTRSVVRRNSRERSRVSPSFSRYPRNSPPPRPHYDSRPFRGRGHPNFIPGNGSWNAHSTSAIRGGFSRPWNNSNTGFQHYPRGEMTRSPYRNPQILNYGQTGSQEKPFGAKLSRSYSRSVSKSHSPSPKKILRVKEEEKSPQISGNQEEFEDSDPDIEFMGIFKN